MLLTSHLPERKAVPILWQEIVKQHNNMCAYKPLPLASGNSQENSQSHYEELLKQSHQPSSPYHFKTNPGSGRMKLPGPQCREVVSLFPLYFVFMWSEQQPNHWLDPLPRKLMEEDGHFQGWQQSLKHHTELEITTSKTPARGTPPDQYFSVQ